MLIPRLFSRWAKPGLALCTTLFLSIACLAQGHKPGFEWVAGTAKANSLYTGSSMGFTMSQQLHEGLSMDLTVLGGHAEFDNGSFAHNSRMRVYGAVFNYTPFHRHTHAVRPWIGSGIGWISMVRQEYAVQQQEVTAPQMSDDAPPMVRNFTAELPSERMRRLAMPVRAGIDVQLTRRSHATLGVTFVPDRDILWSMTQVGFGFQLGRPRNSVRPLLSPRFLI